MKYWNTRFEVWELLLMYLLKLGILVVGEYSSPLKGLWKLDVGVYSDWHLLCGEIVIGRATREDGRECLVQLRRAGLAVEVSGRMLELGLCMKNG